MSNLPHGTEQWEPERYEMREPAAYSFAVTRRELMGIAGAGLLIVATGQPSAAQRRGGGGGAAGPLEARLHIGEDGFITVLSGKIEEGQGSLTELSIAAAEELGVPAGRIRMVMGDTDRVPNDGTTAGSGTTPRTVPAVRKAAAAARGLLLSAAARQWTVDPARVELRDGAATCDGKQYGYADLARSDVLAEAYKAPLPESAAPNAFASWKVLGKPQVRIDSREIVTGTHRYPSDIVRPGMLYGAIMRAPGYGATLSSVDLAAAKQVTGAVPVRDGSFVGCAAPTA